MTGEGMEKPKRTFSCCSICSTIPVMTRLRTAGEKHSSHVACPPSFSAVRPSESSARMSSTRAESGEVALSWSNQTQLLARDRLGTGRCACLGTGTSCFGDALFVEEVTRRFGKKEDSTAEEEA